MPHSGGRSSSSSGAGVSRSQSLSYASSHAHSHSRPQSSLGATAHAAGTKRPTKARKRSGGCSCHSIRAWIGSKVLLLLIASFVMIAMGVFQFTSVPDPHPGLWREVVCTARKVDYYHPCREDFHCDVCRVLVDFSFTPSTLTATAVDITVGDPTAVDPQQKGQQHGRQQEHAGQLSITDAHLSTYSSNSPTSARSGLLTAPAGPAEPPVFAPTVVTANLTIEAAEAVCTATYSVGSFFPCFHRMSPSVDVARVSLQDADSFAVDEKRHRRSLRQSAIFLTSGALLMAIYCLLGFCMKNYAKIAGCCPCVRFFRVRTWVACCVSCCGDSADEPSDGINGGGGNDDAAIAAAAAAGAAHAYAAAHSNAYGYEYDYGDGAGELATNNKGDYHEFTDDPNAVAALNNNGNGNAVGGGIDRSVARTPGLLSRTQTSIGADVYAGDCSGDAAAAAVTRSRAGTLLMGDRPTAAPTVASTLAGESVLADRFFGFSAVTASGGNSSSASTGGSGVPPSTPRQGASTLLDRSTSTFALNNPSNANNGGAAPLSRSSTIGANSNVNANNSGGGVFTLSGSATFNTTTASAAGAVAGGAGGQQSKGQQRRPGDLSAPQTPRMLPNTHSFSQGQGHGGGAVPGTPGPTHSSVVGVTGGGGLESRGPSRPASRAGSYVPLVSYVSTPSLAAMQQQQHQGQAPLPQQQQQQQQGQQQYRTHTTPQHYQQQQQQQGMLQPQSLHRGVSGRATPSPYTTASTPAVTHNGSTSGSTAPAPAPGTIPATYNPKNAHAAGPPQGGHGQRGQSPPKTPSASFLVLRGGEVLELSSDSDTGSEYSSRNGQSQPQSQQPQQRSATAAGGGGGAGSRRGSVTASGASTPRAMPMPNRLNVGGGAGNNSVGLGLARGMSPVLLPASAGHHGPTLAQSHYGAGGGGGGGGGVMARGPMSYNVNTHSHMNVSGGNMSYNGNAVNGSVARSYMTVGSPARSMQPQQQQYQQQMMMQHGYNPSVSGGFDVSQADTAYLYQHPHQSQSQAQSQLSQSMLAQQQMQQQQQYLYQQQQLQQQQHQQQLQSGRQTPQPQYRPQTPGSTSRAHSQYHVSVAAPGTPTANNTGVSGNNPAAGNFGVSVIAAGPVGANSAGGSNLALPQPGWQRSASGGGVSTVSVGSVGSGALSGGGGGGGGGIVATPMSMVNMTLGMAGATPSFSADTSTSPLAAVAENINDGAGSSYVSGGGNGSSANTNGGAHNASVGSSRAGYQAGSGLHALLRSMPKQPANFQHQQQ